MSESSTPPQLDHRPPPQQLLQHSTSNPDSLKRLVKQFGNSCSAVNSDPHSPPSVQLHSKASVKTDQQQQCSPHQIHHLDVKPLTKDHHRETRLPACESCRTRKIKCDALLPACTPCSKSGRECVGRDKSSNVSRGLIWELQQKVQQLQQELENTRSGSFTSLPQGAANVAHKSENRDDSHDTEAQNRPANLKRRKVEMPSHGELASMLSPPPMQTSPNDYIQESSSILESLSSDLSTAPAASANAATNSNQMPAFKTLANYLPDGSCSAEKLFSNSNGSSSADRLRPQSSVQSTGTHRQGQPSKNTAHAPLVYISTYDKSFVDRLVNNYLSYINVALPVINEVRLREMADRVYDEDRQVKATSQPMGRGRKPTERYTVLMTLAIALASLSRSHHFSSELKRAGHRFWAEAQKLLVEFRAVDLEKMRATLLQLQYASLIPKAGSVWELSGASMRLMTELNLHFDREADSITHQTYDEETLDIRRRLFWTAYCFDRSLAIALGRPPGLSDAWIFVPLPSMKPDALLISNSQTGQQNGRQPPPPQPQQQQQQSDRAKQMFQSHIALRRIQSEIHCRLHSVNPRDYSLDYDGISLSNPFPVQKTLAAIMEIGPPTPNIEWQERMIKKLQDWRGTFERDHNLFCSNQRAQANRDQQPPTETNGQPPPSATYFITKEWVDLNFNLTASLLFRPSPNNPRPDQEGLRRAFAASGEAMKLYKVMYRTSRINFPWLATHHLFISGLTYLNSLEKLSRQGVHAPTSLVDVIFNIQSCTSVLEALTSLEDGYNTRVRDTFDAAASAVLKNILESKPGIGASSQVALASNGTGSVGGSHLDGAEATSSASSSSSSVLTTAASTATTTLDATLVPITGPSSISSTVDPFAACDHCGPSEGAMLNRTRENTQISETSLSRDNQGPPTWLSDAIWNSNNSLATAPPGSTILIAAPPRDLHNHTLHSHPHPLSNHHDHGLESNDRHHQPHGFTSSQPYADPNHHHTATANSLFSSSAFLSNTAGGEIGSMVTPNQFDSNNSSEMTAVAATSTSSFGFHNWLLQPYEGGWVETSTPPFDLSPPSSFSSGFQAGVGLLPHQSNTAEASGGGFDFLTTEQQHSHPPLSVDSSLHPHSHPNQPRQQGLDEFSEPPSTLSQRASSRLSESMLSVPSLIDRKKGPTDDSVVGFTTVPTCSTLGDQNGQNQTHNHNPNQDTSFLEMLADVSRSM